MVSKDAEKNREYIIRANEKKKARLRNEEYKKYFATNAQKYRVNKKIFEMMNIRSNKPSICANIEQRKRAII